MTLLVYCPPSSYCMTTVDLVGKESESLPVSLFLMYMLWWALRASYWASSSLIIMGTLFIWSNRPLIILLNKSVQGLGVYGFLCLSALTLSSMKLDSHYYYYYQGTFDCVFYKLYACFHLAIALVVTWWWYGLLYIHLPTKQSKCIWCEVCACIWCNCWGKSKFCEYNLGCFNQVISSETVGFFTIGNLL